MLSTNNAQRLRGMTMDKKLAEIIIDALEDARALINARIQDNIERDNTLKKVDNALEKVELIYD